MTPTPNDFLIRMRNPQHKLKGKGNGKGSKLAQIVNETELHL